MKKQDPFGLTSEGIHYLTGKLVGAYISQQASAYLRLLTVYKGGTIQSVLREIIEEWMNAQEPEGSIIETLADRAYMEWIRRKKKRSDWEDYEIEIKDRLIRRKVSIETIEKICKEMRARIGKDN